MRGPLVRQVILIGAGTILSALLVVGVGTGGLMVAQARHALDQALLAAANANARPVAGERWEVEHSRSPVGVRVLPLQAVEVKEAPVARALHTDRAVFWDEGEDRVLVLPAEEEDAADDNGLHDDEGDMVWLVEARAPRVRVGAVLGTFVGPYLMVAALVALLAALAQGALVRASFRPLTRAREEALRVVEPGAELHLSTGGPSEVRGLIDAMNTLLARLTTAFQAQRRFTAQAAHELRTPLTAMRGELDVCLRRPRDVGRYQATLGRVLAGVERLSALVGGLTMLARVDGGDVEHSAEDVDLDVLVEAVLEQQRAALDAAGCELTVDPPERIRLHLNRPLVEAALGNLLRNVAAYAPGSSVRLTAAAQGAQVVFQLDDDGPGIPEPLREAMFDRFARGSEARRQHPQGLGLGLALAREVARRHGGDCLLTASPAGGTRAVLTLRRGAGPLGDI